MSSFAPRGPPTCHPGTQGYRGVACTNEAFFQQDPTPNVDLTASTVSSYSTRICTKLNVRTTGEIISYAQRAGLVS